MPGLKSALLGLSFVIAPSLAGAQATQDGLHTQSLNQAPPALSGDFAVGDKLKISFFEQLDLPGSGKSAEEAALRTFYQRVDLTADHVVDARGEINLPRFGPIAVAGRSSEEVRDDIVTAYEEQTNQPVDVHIAILERRPVYVVGPVRKPGEFRYLSGMVAIQAIALAGGLGAGENQAGSVIEAGREAERSQDAMTRLTGLIAHLERLEAEGDGRDLRVPDALVDLVGFDLAERLINTEAEASRRAASARSSQAAQFDAILRASRDEVRAMQASIDNAAQAIRTRHAMIADLTEPDPRLTKQNLIIPLRAEIASLETQRQQWTASILEAEQRIARDTAARDKIGLDYMAEVSRDLLKTTDEIARLRTTVEAARRISLSVPGTVQTTRDVGAFELRIIRSTQDGTVTFAAQPTTSLAPGDVIAVQVNDTLLPPTRYIQ